MKRVLHIISGLQVGGAEMMLHRLILSEIREGYDHFVAALDPVGEMRERFGQAGIEVAAFDFKHSPVTESFRLILLIRRMKPEIVQTWLYHADLIGGVAARLAGSKRIIWGVRTTDVAKGGSRTTSMMRWICARLSRRVPHTIVCAAEAARRTHVGLGYCAARMVVIPNGIDIARMQADSAAVSALRQTVGCKRDTLLIGTLGRFNLAKDQQNFVRAAGILAAQHSYVRFLLVGRDCTEGNEALTEWIAATGFTDRFALLGERDDVPVCLAAMDIFALSSRTEGFPNVLAEAMAMGRPCVTTDVGDAAKVLDNCGEVVPPEDSFALARAMAHLVALAPTQRIALGEAGRQRIGQEFSMERCAEHFAAIYEDVLSEPEK